MLNICDQENLKTAEELENEDREAQQAVSGVLRDLVFRIHFYFHRNFKNLFEEGRLGISLRRRN